MTTDAILWESIPPDSESYCERKTAFLDADGLSLGAEHREHHETEWRPWHDEGIFLPIAAVVALRDFLVRHMGPPPDLMRGS